MLILTIRTDNPQAQLALFQNSAPLARYTWVAHRELAETIHVKLKELLTKNKKELNELQGIVIYKGPGSFTGLRIGFSVANALADSLGTPIITSTGQRWQATGVEKLMNSQFENIAIPEYGALPHITKQKK